MFSKLNLTALLTIISAASSWAASLAPITSPSDPIVGGQYDAVSAFLVGTTGTTPNTNAWPFSEGPDKVLDGTDYKYLNFAKLNTGVIFTPVSGSSVALELSLKTANDAPGRNPTTFSLYGSNSVNITGLEVSGTSIALSHFTAIAVDQTTGFTNTTVAYTTNTISLSNSSSYLTYLLFFPTIADAANVNSMQIAEVGLYRAQAVPEPGTTAALAGLAALGVVMGWRRLRS